MTPMEAMDFRIKIAHLKAVREQTGHQRQKSRDDAAQITRDEVAWGLSPTTRTDNEKFGRTALRLLQETVTPPSAGEVAKALLDLWNKAYWLGNERYQTVSRYPLVIYMFSIFMRPISDWLHQKEQANRFVEKARKTIPSRFVNELLQTWGFPNGTKIGKLEYLRIAASVEAQTLKFEDIKTASHHVRNILYKIGDIWPSKQAMKDFKSCTFKCAYDSAVKDPSRATWTMRQWCIEKVILCKKAYAHTVYMYKYLEEYLLEVKKSRGKKKTQVIVKGYHRYVSYVADQWHLKYKGAPRLEDIESLINLKDTSPNAIGCEPSVLSLFIEELPDDDDWKALTFKFTGNSITTADIYGLGSDDNQYSNLFPNLDVYFVWLLQVGLEIERNAHLVSPFSHGQSPANSSDESDV